MRSIFLSFFLCLTYLTANTQCLPDRHNTSPNSGWVSCESSENPNQLRGESHWIMYDLATIYELQTTNFWNHNHITSLENGIQSFAIDVSEDGIEWTELAIVDLPQSTGSAFYEGVEGPDLSGNNARYVLLTALNNYGGDCFGLAEIRINVGQAIITSTENVALFTELSIAPNPTDNFATLTWDSKESESAQVFVYDNNGRQVFVDKIETKSGLNTYTLTTYDLAPAIYRLVIQSNHTLINTELIVQR